MIIGKIAAALVNTAAENGMSERISSGFDLPVLIDKVMPVLSRVDGIKHNAHIAAGAIFHTDRHIQAAAREPVLLVLHG